MNIITLPRTTRQVSLSEITRLQRLAHEVSREICALPVPSETPGVTLLETQLRLCFDYDLAFEQSLVFWEDVANMLGMKNILEDDSPELKRRLAPYRESILKIFNRDDVSVPDARRFCQAIGMASE